MDGQKKEVSPKIQEAYQAMADGNWEGAKRLFEEILAQEPENPDAQIGREMVDRHLREKKNRIDLRTVRALDLPALRDPLAEQPEWGKMIEKLLRDFYWDKAREAADLAASVSPKEALAYLYRMMADCRISTVQELPRNARRIMQHGDYQRAYRAGDENFREWMKLMTEEAPYTPPVPDVEYMARHENLLSLWWNFAMG